MRLADIKTTEYLLDQWGLAVCQAEVDLGYSHISPHERMRARLGATPNITPDEDALIDAALAKLRQSNRLAHDAVVLKYTTKLPLRRIGEEMGRKMRRPPFHQERVREALAFGVACVEWAFSVRPDI
jgi:hypothetical protein